MARTKDNLIIPPPSRDQLQLIRRFRVAFNAIEKHLHNRLHVNSRITFSALVTDYEKKYPAWKSGPVFRDFAIVRNGLVHNESEPDRYLFVPLREVVEEIERQRKACEQTELVLPKFKRRVFTVEIGASLTSTLSEMYAQRYSQAPVYDDTHYHGLLTENGITRWLARQINAKGPALDLSETRVGAALHTEDIGQKVEWVSQDRDLVEVTSLFITNTVLEAVLITKTGKSTEKLLGIMTAWDVAREE